MKSQYKKITDYDTESDTPYYYQSRNSDINGQPYTDVPVDLPGAPAFSHLYYDSSTSSMNYPVDADDESTSHQYPFICESNQYRD